MKKTLIFLILQREKLEGGGYELALGHSAIEELGSNSITQVSENLLLIY